MIIDSRLPLILWAEAFIAMAYIKNRLPNSFTIQQSRVILFQAWNHNAQPKLDHLCIFGNITYVFNKSKPLPKLNTKAWTSYLIEFERRHHYCIYDPARQAVFIRRDVIFDKLSIRPKSDSQSIGTMPASDNKVTLGFSSFCFPDILWVDNSPAILPPQLVTILSPSLLSPVSSNLPLNSDTNKDDENIPSDSEDKLSLPPPSPRKSPTPQIQRKSACLETKPLPNYYNLGRTSTTKTNSSVPLGSPLSKPSQALFQYALAHVLVQASQRFIRIAP